MMQSIGPIQTWLIEHDPLAVVGLSDPVIDRLGYQPADEYVERFYLPIVGPSTLWALRRLAGWLEVQPDGVTVPLAAFASELGLGHLSGRHSPAVRTLARLVAFELAAITPHDELAVRRRVPPLPRRLAQRLPGHLAAAHDEAIGLPRKDTFDAA